MVQRSVRLVGEFSGCGSQGGGKLVTVLLVFGVVGLSAEQGVRVGDAPPPPVGGNLLGESGPQGLSPWIVGDGSEHFDELLVGQLAGRLVRVGELSVDLALGSELSEFVVEFCSAPLPRLLLLPQPNLFVVRNVAGLADLGEPGSGGTVGSIGKAAFLGDLVDAPVEVDGLVRWLLAGDGRPSEPFELVDAPQAVVLTDQVQDERAPSLIGLAGGQGGGDLPRQVPVEVYGADVRGPYDLAGT